MWALSILSVLACDLGSARDAVNLPPVFVEVEPPAEETLILANGLGQIVVVVTDEDVASLTFTWSVDGVALDPERGAAIPLETAEQVSATLTLGSEDIGTLELDVTDSGGKTAAARWFVEES
ncbi:MAG: hypothetical protein AAFV53_24285 [Myxococcota bacterium]